MKSARQTWINATDPDELDAISRRIETEGFWSYVDSQANYRAHTGACETAPGYPFGEQNICTIWPHVRADDVCIAASSRGDMCGERSLGGIPFCGFHFDRAWLAIEAFAHRERGERDERRRASIYSEAGLDLAQVEDAKRLLLVSNERVYFFRVDGTVKIGRSINPERRVKTLRGTKAPKGIRPERGEIIGTIPGGPRVESSLHYRFARHRLTGEWFRYEPIADEIAELIEQRNAELLEAAS